jgi:hypothetical protein
LDELNIFLILIINFYYIINKLIILILAHTSDTDHHLKYILINIFVFFTIRSIHIDPKYYSKTHIPYITFME